MTSPEATRPAPGHGSEPCAVDNPAGELDGREASFSKPKTQSLWPFQADVIARIKAEMMNTATRVLLVIPTGGGKTVTAAHIIADAVVRGRKVLILVHRRELMLQMSRKLHRLGVDHAVIASGYPSRPDARVQVAMITTLHARAIRTATIELPPADLVVVDEAHHAPAGTWNRILEAYPESHAIGLTATPCRADGRGLGGFFKVMVRGPSTAELIAHGFLVPAKVFAPDKPDLSKIGVSRGDFVQGQLAAAMDQPRLVGDVITQYHRYGDGRKAIVFATSRKHAAHIVNDFGEANITAAMVDGETPTEDRDAILMKFAAGAIQIIVNVGVFTEGFDCPDVGCIIVVRPTKSLALYLQMVGRGLRAAPGKKDCIIVDHAGCTEMHGFVDEPIEWALEPDKRARQPLKEARAARRKMALVECPECGGARWQGWHCTGCGWRPKVRPDAVEVVDADLVPVRQEGIARTAAPLQDDKVRFYRMLLWIARERGYSDGWAWHKVNEKFKHQVRTPRGCEPMAPTPEVRSWVKSRAIAWARSQDRSRGAETRGAA